jgi:hypothetical protein
MPLPFTVETAIVVHLEGTHMRDCADAYLT